MITNEDINRAIEIAKKYGGVNASALTRRMIISAIKSERIIAELQKKGVLGLERNARHDDLGRIYPLITK